MTLFVYGTLLADEVLQRLLNRVPPTKPASLTGYARYGIKGQVFPAIIKSTPTSSVHGKVLLELTPDEIQTLDDYEDEEYVKETVFPVLEDGVRLEAQVYVWRDDLRHLLEGEWNYDAWRLAHLSSWVEQSVPCGGHPNGMLE